MSVSVLAAFCLCRECFRSESHLNCRDSNRESCSSFLLPLIDELKQPGDSTGDNTQTLKGVVTAYHGVGFTWKRQNNKGEQKIILADLH